MKKVLIALVVLFAASSMASADSRKGKAKSSIGEMEFKEHCAVCHPNGGNIINPKKTLSKKSLEADNIKTAKDIVAKIRNPGPGMTRFDKKAMSDKEAKQVADYILKTFK